MNFSHMDFSERCIVNFATSTAIMQIWFKQLNEIRALPTAWNPANGESTVTR